MELHRRDDVILVFLLEKMFNLRRRKLAWADRLYEDVGNVGISYRVLKFFWYVLC